MLTSPILIVDSYNTFMRSYCAFPAMNPTTGEQIGGVVGFVKTLARLTRDLKPSRVFVVWEGGGSSRRRALYSEYKMNRKPGKLNRFYEDDIPDTDENKLQQVAYAVSVLKKLPVRQLYVSDVEADDVIAYLCARTFKGQNKVIVSTDKDMYQLLDSTTHAYNLNKKCFVTAESVKQEYFVPPNNFALAKTLCGDGSDNIKGIKGLGFKTVAKRFPLLVQDADVLLQDIITYSQARIGESPVYKRVAESIDDLKMNWRLVYLDGSMISADGVKKLESIVAGYVPPRVPDKMGLIKALLECGALTHVDVDATIESMRYLYVTDDKEENV